jgi:hypothetical protein
MNAKAGVLGHGRTFRELCFAALLFTSLSCASLFDAAGKTPILGAETETSGVVLTEAASSIPPTKYAGALDTWTLIGEDLSVSALAIDPENTAVLYASTSEKMYKSEDGGRTWDLFNEGLSDAVYFDALTVDPQTPTTIYGGSWQGIYKITKDSGRWVLLNDGIPENYNVNCIVVDPSAPDTLYAGATMFTEGGYTSEGVVLKSTNGGEQWSEIRSAIKDDNKISIVLDPMNPSTVYAGFYGGILKSADGGDSWEPINDGLSDTNVLSLAVDPVAPTTLYAGTNGGVYKSTNGGQTWSEANAGFVRQQAMAVFAIVVDPRTPNIVYVSTDTPEGPAGFYKSADGGGHWAEMNNGLVERLSTDDLVIDPVDPSILYMGSADGVYVIHQSPAS